MKRKLIKFGKKAAVLLRHQPAVFFKKASANILLPFFRNDACEISVNGALFKIEPALGPMMKEMRYGVYELELTSLLKKYIRKGDVCVDVGANIGYISAFMLGLVGKSGAVHSFEPVPEYYDRLVEVKRNNVELSLNVNTVALGETEGTYQICVSGRSNIGWNTLVPGFMSEDAVEKKIDIPVKRLDDYLTENDISSVRLIKIDTEGFELPVLKGLEKYLNTCTMLPILIVEIAPTAYPKLNRSLDELADYTENFGYEAVDVTTRRHIDLRTLQTTTNVVLLNPNFH